MLEVMEPLSKLNGWFPILETGKYAMTLTPPRASGRGAGSRLAWPLVAKSDGKPTGELNAIGCNAIVTTRPKSSGCRR
jgi:hypothetical protein